jgi:hypothetical protein
VKLTEAQLRKIVVQEIENALESSSTIKKGEK